ncbi:baseplate J/gp47 family protein [Parasutterella sp.]|uniref:baseplate J/gp47 family protein n=1 Tax=Parasutterella sp. TaxID=2049037 RepID=UPI00352242D5
MASAVNTTESIGGSDIESDASYAERLRLKPNSLFGGRTGEGLHFPRVFSLSFHH